MDAPPPYPKEDDQKTLRIGSIISVYVAGDSIERVKEVFGGVFRSFSIYEGVASQDENIFMIKLITDMPADELTGVLRLIRNVLEQPTIGFEAQGIYYLIK